MNELQQRWRNFLVPRLGQGAKVDGVDYVCKFVENETATLRARIAEMEGARAKAAFYYNTLCDLRDACRTLLVMDMVIDLTSAVSLDQSVTRATSAIDGGGVDEAIVAFREQADELAKLRADLAYSKACAVEGSAATLGELERLRKFVEKVRATTTEIKNQHGAVVACRADGVDIVNALAELDRAIPAQAEPQDQGPYDGLTSTATACHNCPTKLPPEWRVRLSTGLSPGYHEYSLVCCMCGRATEWTKDWHGLWAWWCTNNPALPDGTKVPQDVDKDSAK